MRVLRGELLAKLESVTPGLSPKPQYEQSNCFVFQDGQVLTFNEEIACRQKVSLEITGAVQAAPLLALLRKLKEDELNIDVIDGRLSVKGKGRRVGINMEEEVLLTIDTVEQPETWVRINEEFLEAVNLVQHCAAKDDANELLVCISFHPKWIEASDQFQVMRYRIKTGVSEPTIIKKDSVKHIVNLGMTKMSETPAWMHFKNKSGLVLSCRRYIEEYPDTAEILDCSGDKLVLPKGLVAETELAEIFTSESDTNLMKITLKRGKMLIDGEGISGDYHSSKKLKSYRGEPMEFHISPYLLRDLSQKHPECEITPERIKVDGGKFTYVAFLGAGTDNGEAVEEDDSYE